MANLTTGLDAQVGLAEEATFGTFVVPTLFLMFTNEGLARASEDVVASGIRPGELVAHEDDWESGREGAEGPLEFEWPDRGTALVGKHMLGKITSSQPDPTNAPSVWQHVCEVQSLDGLSLCLQVGRPDNAGTIRPWSYLGCKVAEWELSNEVDGLVVCSLTLDGRKEDKSQTLAAKNFVAGTRKLAWVGGTVTIDGSEAKVTDVSYSGKNPIRNERYFLQTGAELKDEQLDGDGLREYEGQVTMEYSPASEALYDKWDSGAPASITSEWQGRLIEDTYHYGLKVDAPSCRIKGGTPGVGGAEAIEHPISFDVKSTGTGSPITLTITDDQAPA